MPVREILLYPDRRLKEVCAPAQPDEVEAVGADLVDTMRLDRALRPASRRRSSASWCGWSRST